MTKYKMSLSIVKDKFIIKLNYNSKAQKGYRQSYRCNPQSYREKLVLYEKSQSNIRKLKSYRGNLKSYSGYPQS